MQWRIEETWPPLDRTSTEVPLDTCVQTGTRVQGVSGSGGSVSGVVIECDALSSDTDIHISGLTTLHLEVQAAMDGGQIFVRDSRCGNQASASATPPWTSATIRGVATRPPSLPGQSLDHADGIPSH